MNQQEQSASAKAMDTWAPWGACRESDPEAFYPEVGRNVHEAKRVCLTQCVVREQCLRWALGIDGNEPEPDGVWGGLSRRERVKRRRELGLTTPRVVRRDQVAS